VREGGRKGGREGGREGGEGARARSLTAGRDREGKDLVMRVRSLVIGSGSKGR
jgi:hypothetical protein